MYEYIWPYAGIYTSIFMHIQVAYINMHLIAPLCMFICALLLIYMQIYTYVNAFRLAFGLILYHCSPQQGESPTTPRELWETAKCKHNVGQTLQLLVSALHFEVQGNRGCRRECKETTKRKKK